MRNFLLASLALLIAASTSAFAEDGDAVAGARVFNKCAACHIAEEPKNKIGPHLVGIVDRPIASIENCKYSKAMVAFADGDKAWSEELLREYLVAPRAIVKGTRMEFVGIKKPQDLDNLLAYLKSLATE